MNPDDVRALLPTELSVRSVTPLGSGLDHHAYAVNDDLVARVAAGPDAADDVRREAAILAVVPEYAQLPVPEPVLIRPEHGLLVYRRIPGHPLLTHTGRDGYAAVLGAFLAQLQTAPTERLGDLAGVDDTPPAAWLAETRDLAEHLPDGVRRRIAGFLADDPPEPAELLVFTHNDLGVEHVLVEGATITGIIDWSDCAVADPATDLGRLARDLGVHTLDALRPGLDEQTRERAVFYARCTALEDLAYGLESGRDDYLRNARRAVDELFSHP
ncbi:aminoglycoside phosphotransferase (APT) family kinase protein [Hamadaea flava]|uniref:Phosphotransferase family protein n=1 Tax=Hamadaea flava TaxID=1742688 RepID=A0ABV8LV23_9ACTN|nr:phosphotransferase [Hamadaea flava]MCP2329474.1 aminoglycoside phosphotransferase (APT) family kinase protein [Hamadaea flava]